MAIEVDGAKYHSEGSKQAIRDNIKNQIFRKYKIPLYRFCTTGSNEKQRLLNILQENLKNK